MVEGLIIFIVYAASFLVFILVMRLLGAWIFRINELITMQKDILQEVHTLRKVIENNNTSSKNEDV